MSKFTKKAIRYRRTIDPYYRKTFTLLTSTQKFAKKHWKVSSVTSKKNKSKSIYCHPSCIFMTPYMTLSSALFDKDIPLTGSYLETVLLIV